LLVASDLSYIPDVLPLDPTTAPALFYCAALHTCTPTLLFVMIFDDDVDVVAFSDRLV